MIKIGITGSISSGKSSFAKILSKNKYPIFNADKAVAEVYNDKFYLNKIIKAFKFKEKKKVKLQVKNILNKNSFSLKKLERIIHPVVRKKMKKFILMKKNKDILIFDIPLLVESNLMHLFDVIIFVDCKKSLRLKRFIKRGGDKSTFKILNKRQTPGRKKVKFCNYKVNNNKNLKDLKKNAKLIMSSYE